MPEKHRRLPHPAFDAAAPSDWMGVRAVEVMLSDLTFPMKKEELLERAGRWEVPITNPNDKLPLSELLEPVDPTLRFRNAKDVAEAVGHEWPELRS